MMKANTAFRDAFLFASLGVVTSLNFNVTAISGHGHRSRFECWQLSEPFVQSKQPGVIGTANSFLGDVANMTYNVIPAGFDSGFHTVPANQWAVVLNGVAVITLPNNSTVSVTTDGGELAMLFFEDTATVSNQGHVTYYPGITETIFLQIPTRGGALPKHTVLLENAPCSAVEYDGLRSLAKGG
ncbi:hypothetical protein GGR58DRAFT_437137 [Xylaria digitata]|nr:hypothetical protein GGR58DRAFT_437137 [Xylaria digitata]